MKIEVGEYVRVKEWNVIGKILKITVSRIYIDSLGFGLTREQIHKHRKNIIDLIEPGDYVNGYKVEEVSAETNEVLLDHNGFGWRTLKDGDKIVTHEQFASVEYKVKEKV